MAKKSYLAIHIDSENREIKVVEIDRKNSLTTLQSLVGGYITPGHYLENGDMVYVDDNGLLGGPENFFLIQGAHQPFAGNGVMVAGEEYEDVISTVESLKSKVKFLNAFELQLLIAGSKGA